jgi:hypothetical protein
LDLLASRIIHPAAAIEKLVINSGTHFFNLSERMQKKTIEQAAENQTGIAKRLLLIVAYP